MLLPQSASRKELRRIAVLVETSTLWGRQIILGIKSYAQRHRKWHIFVEPHGSNEVIRPPNHWRGDGIIADIHSVGSLNYLEKLALPIVNVSDVDVEGGDFPQVAGDIRATAALAAKYYRERGYRELAYIRLERSPGDAQKCAAFKTEVEKSGGVFHFHEVKARAYGVPDWNLSIPRLAAWLRALPKPIGILSWSVGHELIEACRIANLRMPGDIAVLMFSYDNIFLEVPALSLSGILQPSAKVGYEAAALLDRLLGGAAAGPRKLIEPLGVNSRMSTDALAVSDRSLTKALRYIHAHPNTPLGVDQLAAAVGVSRRLLERRFMEVCRQTPGDYIRATHLDRAKQLLRDTSFSIPEVAGQSGFSSPDYMGFYFRKKTGMTPLKYRQKMNLNIGNTL